MPNTRYAETTEDPEFQSDVPPDPSSEQEPEPLPPEPFGSSAWGRTMTYIGLGFLSGIFGGVLGAAMVAPHWASKSRETMPRILTVDGVNASWVAIRDRQGASRLYLGLNEDNRAELNLTGPEANPGFQVQVDERGRGRLTFYNGNAKAVEVAASGGPGQGVFVYSRDGQHVAEMQTDDGRRGGVFVHGMLDEGGACLRAMDDGLPSLNLLGPDGVELFRAPSELPQR